MALSITDYLLIAATIAASVAAGVGAALYIQEARKGKNHNS